MDVGTSNVTSSEGKVDGECELSEEVKKQWTAESADDDVVIMRSVDADVSTADKLTDTSVDNNTVATSVSRDTTVEMPAATVTPSVQDSPVADVIDVDAVMSESSSAEPCSVDHVSPVELGLNEYYLIPASDDEPLDSVIDVDAQDSDADDDDDDDAAGLTETISHPSLSTDSELEKEAGGNGASVGEDTEGVGGKVGDSRSETDPANVTSVEDRGLDDDTSLATESETEAADKSESSVGHEAVGTSSKDAETETRSSDLVASLAAALACETKPRPVEVSDDTISSELDADKSAIVSCVEIEAATLSTADTELVASAAATDDDEKMSTEVMQRVVTDEKLRTNEARAGDVAELAVDNSSADDGRGQVVAEAEMETSALHQSSAEDVSSVEMTVNAERYSVEMDSAAESTPVQVIKESTDDGSDVTDKAGSSNSIAQLMEVTDKRDSNTNEGVDVAHLVFYGIHNASESFERMEELTFNLVSDGQRLSKRIHDTAQLLLVLVHMHETSVSDKVFKEMSDRLCSDSNKLAERAGDIMAVADEVRSVFSNAFADVVRATDRADISQSHAVTDTDAAKKLTYESSDEDDSECKDMTHVAVNDTAEVTENAVEDEEYLLQLKDVPDNTEVVAETDDGEDINDITVNDGADVTDEVENTVENEEYLLQLKDVTDNTEVVAETDDGEDINDITVNDGADVTDEVENTVENEEYLLQLKDVTDNTEVVTETDDGEDINDITVNDGADVTDKAEIADENLLHRKEVTHVAVIDENDTTQSHTDVTDRVESTDNDVATPGSDECAASETDLLQASVMGRATAGKGCQDVMDVIDKRETAELRDNTDAKCITKISVSIASEMNATGTDESAGIIADNDGGVIGAEFDGGKCEQQGEVTVDL